jgi:hypothetical protein
MKANEIQLGDTTEQGVYIGKGHKPFTEMHCFQRANGKSFLPFLDGEERPADTRTEEKKALDNAMERFFSSMPSISLD